MGQKVIQQLGFGENLDYRLHPETISPLFADFHFIQKNCLYSVWYGCSAQTSPKSWFGKHE